MSDNNKTEYKPFTIFLRFQTIPQKNYETAHMKERLCLPYLLHSNVGCDKVQILLNSRSFNFQHCLQGRRGAIT